MEVKTCVKCGEEKSIGDFYRRASGYQRMCKECQKAYNRERRAGNRKNDPDPTVSEKCCTRCREVKPIAEFSANRESPDGYEWGCRSCRRAYDEKRWAKIASERPQKFQSNTHMQCTTCGDIKVLDEFYDNKGCKSGKSGKCKQCYRDYEQARRWTPDRVAAKAAFRLKGIEGTVCEYLTCDEMQSAAGLCSRHYKRKLDGSLDLSMVIRIVRLCGAPGCDLEIPDNKWSCKWHANQMRRFGETWPVGCCKDCREPLPETAGKGRVYCDQCGPHRGRMHGKSRQWFEAKLAEQGNACAVCGTVAPAGRYGGWNVDHDHDCCPGGTSCGECVRDILCYKCNTFLGMAGDDPERMEAGAAYVRRHKTTNVRAA